MNDTAINELHFGDIIKIIDKHCVDKFAFVYDNYENSLQIFSIMKNQENSENTIPIFPNDLESGNLPKGYSIKITPFKEIELNFKIERIGKFNKIFQNKVLRCCSHIIAKKYFYHFLKPDDEFIPDLTQIKYGGRIFDHNELQNLMDSCLDFWLTSGRFSNQLENDISDYLGVKYTILCNSGSSANLLAISALTSKKLNNRRLKPGDEILTTACNFPTTVNPIIQNNLTPVFVDVDIGTYNCNTNILEEAISEKTKGIILAHTLGNPFNVEKILKICSENKLWLIEDNCDAFGSKYKNRYTGTFGDISTLSFYPAHHITTGEGGAVITNNALLKKILISFRDWGRDCWCAPGEDNSCKKRFQWKLGGLPHGYDHKYIYSHIGYNLKITDLQAAIGVAQLRKLPCFVDQRENNFNLLFNCLKPYKKFLILPKILKNAKPAWFGFPITVKENKLFDRANFVKYLEKHKIATRNLFAGNIIHQPSMEGVYYRIFKNLKNTDMIMNNTFWIGVYPGITQIQIEHINSTVKDFFKEIQQV